MESYDFVVFDPRPQGAEKNDKIFAEAPVGVLGIEVTVPALASRCTLGNIDPQHGGGNASHAAIETALEAELPPAGAVLATIRADLDAVGAMAILAMRAEPCSVCGGEGEVEASHAGAYAQPCAHCQGSGAEMLLIQAMRDRIQLIAESDRFARGGWPGARPLPTVESSFDDSTASTETDSRLAPIAAAVADFRVPLSERVETLKKWLMTGEEPAGYRERWIAERQAIAAAVADGTIKVSTVTGGEIAVVQSSHRAATSVGYSLAPVVVALNPEFRLRGGEPHKKFTICQFAGGYVDLKAVLAELNELEAGWGGSPTIGGSPQGVSSALTIEQVVEVLSKHLLKERCVFCGCWSSKEEWKEMGREDGRGWPACPVCRGV